MANETNEKKYVSLESLQVFLSNIKNTFMSYSGKTDTLPQNANEGDVYKIEGTERKWSEGVTSVVDCDEISVGSKITLRERDAGTPNIFSTFNNIVPLDGNGTYNGNPITVKIQKSNGSEGIYVVTYAESFDMRDYGSVCFVEWTGNWETNQLNIAVGDELTFYVLEGEMPVSSKIYIYHNGKWEVLFEVKSTESITQSDMEVYVDTKLASLVDSAPETLNTLNELAEALGDDPNFATTIATQIGNKAEISHKHTLSDITDYTAPTIDSALSPTSTNSVQNKVLNDEFNAISNAMGALEVAIDNKADSDHTHNVANLEYAVGDASLALTLADVIDDLHSKIEDKSDKTHTHYASTLIYDSENENTTLNDVINGLDSYIGSKADTEHTHTVSDISDINDLELITVDDIDAICATIVLVQNAEEVSF